MKAMWIIVMILVASSGTLWAEEGKVQMDLLQTVFLLTAEESVTVNETSLQDGMEKATDALLLKPIGVVKEGIVKTVKPIAEMELDTGRDRINEVPNGPKLRLRF